MSKDASSQEYVIESAKCIRVPFGEIFVYVPVSVYNDLLLASILGEDYKDHTVVTPDTTPKKNKTQPSGENETKKKSKTQATEEKPKKTTPKSKAAPDPYQCYCTPDTNNPMRCQAVDLSFPGMWPQCSSQKQSQLSRFCSKHQPTEQNPQTTIQDFLTEIPSIFPKYHLLLDFDPFLCFLLHNTKQKTLPTWQQFADALRRNNVHPQDLPGFDFTGEKYTQTPIETLLERQKVAYNAFLHHFKKKKAAAKKTKIN